MNAIDFESFYGINCLSNGPNLEVTRQYTLFYVNSVTVCSAWHTLELGESSKWHRIKHEITKFRPDSAHKRIAILDDDKDVTTTFRTILESDLIRGAK